MPWKNGGGVTTEIFACPPSGDFNWRVSIATVNADGPFSKFNGYERHIMTLSGEGMVLDIEGSGKFTLEPLRPLTFSGDAQVHGSLLRETVLDFNLIVRRNFGHGILYVTEGSPGNKLGSEKSSYLVYVLHGKCKAGGYELESNASFYLGKGDFFTLPAPLKLAVCEVTPHLPPLPNLN
jgi:environmental stress-induced protein Ves